MKIVCVVENDIIKESDLQSEHGLSFWIETPNGLVLLIPVRQTLCFLII